MRPSKALIGLMIFLLSATGAGAQEVANAEGPAIQITASALYDSNVSRSSEALAQLRHLTRADELYSILAVLDYNKSFGSGSVYLTGTGGYAFYQNNSILNRETLNFEGGLRQRFLGNCEATLRGNYSRQQSDLQDIDVITVAQNVVSIPTVSLNMKCNQETGFSPYADVSQTWVTNSALIVKQSDSQTLTADAGVAYRQPVLGEIDFFGQYGATDFNNRFVPIGSDLIQDGYIVNGGGIRINHDFGTKLNLSATVRYTALHPRIPFEPKFNGITYEGELTYSPTYRLQFTALASRATNPSNQIGTSYSVDENYGVGMTYKIGPRLNFGLNGTWESQNFSGDFAIPGTVITSQTIKSLNGYLRYEFSRRLSLNLTAGQQNRHANIATFNYSSTRVGLSVTAAF